MSVGSWLIQKWQEFRATVWDTVAQRFRPLKGDSEGRVEHKPHGSLSLPFAQDPDGTLRIRMLPAVSRMRLGRRFYIVDSLGNQILADPVMLEWTTHVQATDALVETLVVQSIGVGDKVADMTVASYLLNVYYYIRWRYRMEPDAPIQVARQRFMYVP